MPLFKRDIDGAAAGAAVFGVVGIRLDFELGRGVLTDGDREVGGAGVFDADVGDAVQQELVRQALAAVHVEVLHAVVVPGAFGAGGFGLAQVMPVESDVSITELRPRIGASMTALVSMTWPWEASSVRAVRPGRRR